MGEKSIIIIKNPNIVINLTDLFNSVYRSEDFKKLYAGKAFPSRLHDVNDYAGIEFICSQALKQITENEYRQRNITFTCTQSFDSPILDALLKIFTLHGVNIITRSDGYHYIKQFQEFADYDEATILISVTSIAPVVDFHSRPLTLTNSFGQTQQIVQQNDIAIKPELRPGLFVKIKYKIWKPTDANPFPRLIDFEADIATTKLPGGCALQIVPGFIDNYSYITAGGCDLLFPYRGELCTFLNVPHDRNFQLQLDGNNAARNGVLNWFAESPLRRDDSDIEKVETLIRQKVYSGSSHWRELAHELIQLSQTKLASLLPTDHQTRRRYQTLAQVAYGLWLDVIFYDLNDAKTENNQKKINSLKQAAHRVLIKAGNAYLLDQIADDSNLAKKFNRMLDELAVPPAREEERSNSEFVTFASRLNNYQIQTSNGDNSVNGSPQPKKKSQQPITDCFALYLKTANDFIATNNAKLFNYPAQLKTIEAELQTVRALSRKRVEEIQRVDKNSRNEKAVEREFAGYNRRIEQLEEKHDQIIALQKLTPDLLAKEKNLTIYKLLAQLRNLNTHDAKIIGDSPLLSLLQALESTLLSTTPDETGEKDSDYLHISHNLIGLVKSKLVDTNNSLAQLKHYYSLLQIGLGLSLDLINSQLCNKGTNQEPRIGINFLKDHMTIIHNNEFKIDKNMPRRLFRVAQQSARQGLFDETGKFANDLLEECNKHIASLPENVRNDAKTQAHLTTIEQISYGMQLEVLLERLKWVVQYKEVNGLEFNFDAAIDELTSTDSDSAHYIVLEMQAIVRATFNFVAHSNQPVDSRLQQLMYTMKRVLLIGITDHKEPVEVFMKLVIDKMEREASNSEPNNLTTGTGSLLTLANGGERLSGSVVSKYALVPTVSLDEATHRSASPTDFKPPISATDETSAATSLPISMALPPEPIVRDRLAIVEVQTHIPRVELLRGTIVNNRNQLKLRDDYLLTHSIEKVVADVQLDPVFMLQEITEQLERYSSVDMRNTEDKKKEFTIKFFAAVAACISCANIAALTTPMRTLKESLLNHLRKIATEADISDATNLRSLISNLFDNSDVATTTHQLELVLEYIQEIAKISYKLAFDAKPLALATGAAVTKNSLEQARRELKNDNTDLLDQCLTLLTDNINTLPFVNLFENASLNNSGYDLLADMVDSAIALLEHKKDKMTFVDMQRVIAIYQKVNSLKKEHPKLYSSDLINKKNSLYILMGEYAENRLSKRNYNPLAPDTCKAIKLVVDLEPRKFVNSNKVSFIKLLNVYSLEESVLHSDDIAQVAAVPVQSPPNSPAVSAESVAANVPIAVSSPPVALAAANPPSPILISKKDSESRAGLIDLALATVINKKPNQACHTEVLELLNRKDPGEDEQAAIAAKTVQARLGNNPEGYSQVESLLSNPATVERLSAKEIADLLRPHPELIKKVIVGGGLIGNLFGSYPFNPVRRKLSATEISSLLESRFNTEILNSSSNAEEISTFQLARDYVIQPGIWQRFVSFFGVDIYTKFSENNNAARKTLINMFDTIVNPLVEPLEPLLANPASPVQQQRIEAGSTGPAAVPTMAAATVRSESPIGGSLQVITAALSPKPQSPIAHVRTGSLSGSDDEAGPLLPKDKTPDGDSRNSSPGTTSSPILSGSSTPRDLEEARKQLEQGIHDRPVPAFAADKKPDTPPIDRVSTLVAAPEVSPPTVAAP